MLRVARRLFSEESGIQHAEEALLLGLIAVAAIVAVSLLGTNVSNLFDGVATKLGTVTVP